MGFDKLLAPLGEKPVILWTLRAFQECGEIDGIWVVAGEERGAKIAELAAGLGKFRGIVPGGAERHLSVWNGLQALPRDCELVAVHDGARPLIQPAQISRCVSAAEDIGGAACARRVTETVKRADDGGWITHDVDRQGLWIMETPQVFKYEWLMQAYQDVIRQGTVVTDEVSAYLYGLPVIVVENLTPNPKITLPGDLESAARLAGFGAQ